MPSISKAEYEGLKFKVQAMETWHQAFKEMVDKCVEQALRIRDYKEKIWAAEQEIHDLKYELELYKKACTDNREDADIYYKDSQLWRDKYLNALTTITNLRLDNLTLMAGQVVHFANEIIEPPSCLNTKDAQTWTHTYIHGPNEKARSPHRRWIASRRSLRADRALCVRGENYCASTGTNLDDVALHSSRMSGEYAAIAGKVLKPHKTKDLGSDCSLE